MCVIFHQPAGRQIPEALLRAAAVCNADGWGLMGTDADGSVVVERHRHVSVASIASRLADLPGADLCLHLRQRTRGPRDRANAHPLAVNARFELMHNGTLALPASDRHSDSRWLASRLLAPLLDRHPDLAADAAFVALVEAGLTPRNRVVLLDRERRQLLFLNRRHGVERDGLWISGWHWIERGRRRLAAMPGSAAA